MSTILDPTDEKVPVARQLTPRTGKITGRLALLDISKPRGNVLLDRLESLLSERLPGIEIQRYARECQFADCTHIHEPGCAVLEAVNLVLPITTISNSDSVMSVLVVIMQVLLVTSRCILCLVFLLQTKAWMMAAARHRNRCSCLSAVSMIRMV